jgi:hypothetical protein
LHHKKIRNLDHDDDVVDCRVQDQVLMIVESNDGYTKLTADQAGAALAKRLAHESDAPKATATPLKAR